MVVSSPPPRVRLPLGAPHSASAHARPSDLFFFRRSTLLLSLFFLSRSPREAPPFLFARLRQVRTIARLFPPPVVVPHRCLPPQDRSPPIGFISHRTPPSPHSPRTRSASFRPPRISPCDALRFCISHSICNNLHALARAATLALVPVDAALSTASAPAAAHAFAGAFAACVVLSQQFHAWAHEKRRRLPPGVEALQSAGVLVSRAQHAAHHRQPYNTNYCIVSGMWNGVLDRYRVFEALEMVVFLRTGVRPRSWDETDASWMEVAGDDHVAATAGAGDDDGLLQTASSISSD